MATALDIAGNAVQLDQQPVPQDEEMDDLFGQDHEMEEAKQYDRAVSERTSDRGTSTEGGTRNPLEYDSDDQPQEQLLHRKEADVSIPNIPVPRSTSGETWVIRMPNYVNVDPKPFHPDTYVGPEHEDEESQQQHVEAREKSMSIKLKVENTVRWKWTKDASGKDQRQSNSRIIRWSDGSISLRLGKELFDINQTVDTSGGISRQSLGGPHASQGGSGGPSTPPSPAKSQGLTYLVAQHKRSQVLQAEALITGYMTLRPMGMQSETHRMLVRAVGQRHNKVARLRMAPDPRMDPEKEKLELLKQTQKKSKKKAEDDGLGGRRRRSAYARRRVGGHDVWSDDDEDGHHDFAALSDDEDGPVTDGSPRKKRRSNDSDARKGGEYQEDDFLVADSPDDDEGDRGDAEGGATKRARQRRDEQVEQDPLDKIEEQLQEQEERRRRRHSGGSTGEKGGADDSRVDKGGEEEMDVESEEDEDDFRVRRTGTSSRKKRAIDFEEEDDE